MLEDVIKMIEEKGHLLTPDAVKVLRKAENPEELARIALENLKLKDKLAIGPEDFELKETAKPIVEKVVVERTGFKYAAKDYEARVRILNGMSTSSAGTLDDFVEHFKSRYDQIAQMLASRRGNSVIRMGDLKTKRGLQVRLVGIVTEKRDTKNGHILLRVEDPTGTANALIPASNKQLMAFGKSLILDEVIAIDGKLSKDLFIISDIQQPDLPLKEAKKTEEDIVLVMISDLHIGSKLFMRKNFEHFLAWLRGEVGDERQQNMASRVKYITIAGDVCDGIGVYPRQEEELEITDIFEQYHAFCEYMQQIPEHIQVIIGPGNHDAVKNADPQPTLPKELVGELYDMKNMTLVNSPAMVELHGVKTLVYHGTSFDDIIASIPELSYENTEKVMLEILKRRHVHPIYGGKPITPERNDSLVISDVPDIFHAGHLHKNGYGEHHGVTCVNSGTWQQITPYQLRQGHKPTPCIMPAIEMKTGKLDVIHFDRAL